MMRTIPRYVPAIDLRARFAGLLSTNPELAITELSTSLGVVHWRQLLPTSSGRHAFAVYLAELAPRAGARKVLLSAQICPLVPSLLIQHGFRPVFIDIELGAPVPGTQQYIRVAR